MLGGPGQESASDTGTGPEAADKERQARSASWPGSVSKGELTFHSELLFHKDRKRKIEEEIQESKVKTPAHQWWDSSRARRC